MILDHALVAAGDEDEMLDAGFARLVDHMLDHRPVDHGQHFLRHRLGRGQKACAEPGDGKHGLADASWLIAGSVALMVKTRGQLGGAVDRKL